MTDIHEFDDIRPFLPEELPAAYDRLLNDDGFKAFLAFSYKDIPFEKAAALIRSCKTNLEFQKACIYPVLTKLLSKNSTGLTADFSNISHDGYTFISNHRDIVLDSALLDYVIVDKGLDTVEIAIGDNLLVYPWIKDLVRINRSFIVQRALTMRQMLLASAKMSKYMHYVISEKHGNIWIAQREGRAKDSDDRTQESVLKMMSLGGGPDAIASVKSLNIVPLAISYEYDPCDYLKAEEFQNKRDIPGFKKSQQDDLDNMKTGILGYKGHIHYHAAPCINDWLDTLDPNIAKADLFPLIAEHIDQEIHKHYKLYPCNYVAAGMDASAEDKAKFDAYINHQMSQIKMENPDYDFLREKMREMYANPAINQMKAKGQSL